jgi:hypothetical protein
VLATLTPFPTLTPQATPVDDPALGVPGGPDAGDGPSLIEQVQGIDTGRFSQAFWRGARITLYLFLGLAGYILFRGVFRRLWRLIMTRLWQQ